MFIMSTRYIYIVYNHMYEKYKFNSSYKSQTFYDKLTTQMDKYKTHILCQRALI